MSWLKNKILEGDKGLGDTVERFTKATGIKNLVEKISEFTGKDCGCKKRKNLLNKMFSYNSLDNHNKNTLDVLIQSERDKDHKWKAITNIKNTQFIRLTNENLDKEISALQDNIKANIQDWSKNYV
tara:strand:+ start:225 stop:602 length:378 start_codon:yes stop_codon:yes gene_type:complete